MRLKGLFMLCAALMLGAGMGRAADLTVSKIDAAPGETVDVNVKFNSITEKTREVSFSLNYVNLASERYPDLIPIGIPENPAFGPEGTVITTEPGRILFRFTRPDGFSGTAFLLSAKYFVPVNTPQLAKHNFQLRDVQALDMEGNRLNIFQEPGYVRLRESNTAARVTASTARALAGRVGTVSIQATEILRRVTGIAFTLEYDKRLGVTKEDVKLGSFLKGQVKAEVLEPGKMKVTVTSSDVKTGPGEIARVSFLLPSDVSPGQEFPVHMADVTAKGLYGPSYPVTPMDGKIIVAHEDGRDVPQIPEARFRATAPEKVRSGGIARIDFYAEEGVRNLSGVIFKLVVSQKTPVNAPDLQYSHFTPGELLPDATVQASAKEGAVQVALVSSGKASGPGRLVSLNFKVPDQGAENAVYSFSITSIRFSVNGTDYIPGGWSSDNLSVTARLKGDVANAEQGDELINTLDVITVLQILIGTRTATELQMQAADVNCDTSVDLSDAVAILRHIVGIGKFCDEE